MIALDASAASLLPWTLSPDAVPGAGQAATGGGVLAIRGANVLYEDGERRSGIAVYDLE